MGWTFTSSTSVRNTKTALPLIVTHGWPGSITEQMKIIDPLTNPDSSMAEEHPTRSMS